ncbi:NHLP leader peptide family RiPP precursor [Saccharibacillus alkalitolerans]|uniref:NHLP leader peptide family natural product n=1 Tax=Saccharibacillus alkalitolerans TaxID=2705290 RepID=A0ABX0F399_9BACL|nr:NHLP leader peptide family RiPP precursor [Saccharibacillus alkalitolerans]NGZ74905.1 NHLP leader peptide family natural product precursor [Saccharibacillus alkalitolerans]
MISMTNLTREAALKTQVIQKAWEDPEFRARLLADAKAALRDAFGVELPDGVKLTAVEETAQHFYLVVPPHPSAVIPQADRISIEPAAMWGTGG